MTDEELIAWLRMINLYHVDSKIIVRDAADRIEALVDEVERLTAEKGYALIRLMEQDDLAEAAEQLVATLEDKVEKLEAAVIAAAKIGQIVGFLGSDEDRIEAFREACGPELLAKARAALAEIEGEQK